MNRGYIKLFRKITESDIWDNGEPFDKRSAWIDLILLANHKDNYTFYGMGKVLIRRGQHKTSVERLQERWHWGRKKVDAFLGLLQNEGMIYYEKHKSGMYRGILITVVNYNDYQDFLGVGNNQKDNQKSNQKDNQGDIKGTIKGTIKRTINNNVKNDIKNDLNNDSKMSIKPSADSDSCEVVYEE